MGVTADNTDFDQIVRNYERLGEPMTRPFALQVLDLVSLAPGDHVLDVATGTGVLAVAAAERGARVLATDIAPGMVTRTAERLRPYAGCDARVMKLEAIEAPTARFDSAFSLFGVLAFTTWPKGLSELVRVTRPGGQIVVTMWTERQDATPAVIMKRVFEEVFPGRELWPEGFFPSWSTCSLENALHWAGCEETEVQVCKAEWRPLSPSGDPMYPADALTEGDPMFRNFPGYNALTEMERARLRAALSDAFAGQDGTIRLPTEAFVARGRKAE